MHTDDAGLTAPLGVEVQQTTFAFNRSGPLGNTIFLKFKLINKGGNRLDSAYVGVWLDPDLGGFTDDLVGCDVGRGLGYVYNATNADAQYGSHPPAVGLALLQGPVARPAADALGMTTFIKYVNGTDPITAMESYNYMRGLHADGSEIHVFDDPLQAVTTFQVSGLDPGLPSSPANWLDSNPGDRRLLVASGPFTMGPGESQEIIAAILVGQGSDRLASVADMRSKDDIVQQFYESGLGLPPALAVVAPPFVSVMEGQPTSFSVQASSSSGDPVTLAATPLPLGSAFVDHGNGTGDFAWTPDFAQAGSYTIQFTAAAASGSVGSALTTILVENSNRPPTADAGGPYSGVVGVPIQFDGRGSSDPDGDPLSFYWAFGDGDASQAMSPSHAYAYAGTYAVQLYVSVIRIRPRPRSSTSSPRACSPTGATAPSGSDPGAPPGASGWSPRMVRFKPRTWTRPRSCFGPRAPASWTRSRHSRARRPSARIPMETESSRPARASRRVIWPGSSARSEGRRSFRSKWVGLWSRGRASSDSWT